MRSCGRDLGVGVVAAALLVVPCAATAGSSPWPALGACTSPPGEARDLTIASDKQTLTWSAPLDDGGAAPVYDTIRSDAPSDFDADAFCVESDDGDLQATLTAVPLAGTTFYYLVRAENACGHGTLGPGIDGLPRPAARTCDPPPPPTIDYAGSTHTPAECQSAGGSVVAVFGDPNGTEVCRVNASTCPAGWAPAGDWTTTSSTGTPWSMSYATFQTACNGVSYDWPAVSASGTLFSGSHPWSNTPPESALCLVWRPPPATQTFGDCGDPSIDQVIPSTVAPPNLCSGAGSVSRIDFSQGGGPTLARWERGNLGVSATAVVTQRGCY